MDSCGERQSKLNVLVLRIEFLGPNTASMYHRLDLGLIANSKIRHRSFIFHQIVENTLSIDAEETILTETRTMMSGDFKKVTAYHGDAISVFNLSRNGTTNKQSCNASWKVIHYFPLFSSFIQFLLIASFPLSILLFSIPLRYPISFSFLLFPPLMIETNRFLHVNLNLNFFDLPPIQDILQFSQRHNCLVYHL